MPLLRAALAIAAGAGAWWWEARRSPRSPETGEPAVARAAAAAEDPEAAEVVVARMMELVRRATDAHEAALWRMDASGRTATLLELAAHPAEPAPPAVVDLEGHPFGWAILERVHVHLQRGRRVLPSMWAEEMLLVPVDLPDGVLALAYSGGVPPGAEPVALEAGKHLGTLWKLLAIREDAERAEARVQALYDAVRTLPAEMELDRFAAKLAETVRKGTGAGGAAVALAPGEHGRGRILAVAAESEEEAPALGPSFSDGDSRVALALKHGVTLAYVDLRREKERLPLCTPGEQWPVSPRSAAVLPLTAEGRAVGAVVVWHSEPGRFGEPEMDLLRLLASAAPLPMRSASRLDALDRRASTDSLTGLPNRRAFEGRLATATGYFDRYARPFALVMLDVDHFKQFNDTWGHDAGDRVLRHVAETMRSTVREVDVAARLGGEEFVVLLPETGLRAGIDAAERIRRAIEGKPVIWEGRPLSVTLSAGVAACPDCVATPGEVLALADAALYRSKGAGRNRVTAAPRTGTATGEGDGTG